MTRPYGTTTKFLYLLYKKKTSVKTTARFSKRKSKQAWLQGTQRQASKSNHTAFVLCCHQHFSSLPWQPCTILYKCRVQCRKGRPPNGQSPANKSQLRS